VEVLGLENKEKLAEEKEEIRVPLALDTAANVSGTCPGVSVIGRLYQVSRGNYEGIPSKNMVNALVVWQGERQWFRLI
jgi:hypothetical protein